MAETVAWVSDQLHELVGLSDRQVAEYITELAKRSKTCEEFTRKLKSIDAIKMNSAVEEFVDKLWNIFSRKEDPVVKKVAEKRKSLVYKLLLEDEPAGVARAEKPKKKKLTRNIRTKKFSSWESDEEDVNVTTSTDDSDSDEWERCFL